MRRHDTLARRNFPDRDPIGARLFVATGPNSGELAPIVGVVADLHYTNLETPVDPELFVHLASSPRWR